MKSPTKTPANPRRTFEPQHFAFVNWIGFCALMKKEILRFITVYTQTIFAPVITTLLFLAIFSLALGGAVREVNGVTFQIFLAPGLIIMSVAQNAFANTSSSMMISKIQGNIVDVLLPPISPIEMVSAYILAGIVRGIVVGVATFIGMAVFLSIPVHNIAVIVLFGTLGSMMLALLGLAGAIWAEKFDHIAAVTNFIITPFSFLSGTFYSIDRLPEPFYTLAHFNPFFYMIDGFRYGFLGRADAAPILGALVLIATNAVLGILVWKMVRHGYKLKA